MEVNKTNPGCRPGRYLGLDYGKARVGVAISDENCFLAIPLCSITKTKIFLEELKNRIIIYTLKALVIGLPLMMNGTEGAMAIEVKEFAKLLENFLKIPTVLWDERLSSLQAERLLSNIGLNRKKRTQSNDAVAASIILQSYLDSCENLKSSYSDLN
jgi:putative holliday junction resolvase